MVLSSRTLMALPPQLDGRAVQVSHSEQLCTNAGLYKRARGNMENRWLFRKSVWGVLLLRLVKPTTSLLRASQSRELDDLDVLSILVVDRDDPKWWNGFVTSEIRQ